MNASPRQAHRREHTLHDGWVLRLPNSKQPSVPTELVSALRGGIPAVVPGSVMTALIDAGLLPDPCQSDREADARWVGWTSWEYARQIEVPPRPADATAELSFDGLDTIAEIVWDGQVLATTRNMHRRYVVDVTERATPGTHELVLRFASPEAEAEDATGRLGGPMPNPYDRPFSALRKAAYTFGWDWGPDFPSAGPWRAVRWLEHEGARIADVRVSTARRDEGAWELTAVVDAAGASEGRFARCRLGDVDGRAGCSDGVATIELAVSDPEPWLPRSLGRPHLHDLTVELLDDAGTVLDERSLRVGFREIDLVSEPDDQGRSFALRVDGREHYVRGLNWIPASPFPGRTTRADLGAALEELCALDADLIRVWGGGFYESDDFYDLCDELGILVWQDFAFACSAYSEEPEIAEEVRAEARDNVARLAHHPSLAIWCGSNENHWAVQEWDGWQEQLAGRAWGEGYYDDLLPGIVAELDPRRPYVPGSPWSGTPGVPASDYGHGCAHVWDVWNDVPHEVYQDHRPRFVSEFGYQGPPAWSTMAICIGEQHMHPDDPVLAAHQKAEDAEEKVARGLDAHGGTPTDPDDWWWRCQQIQADAVRVGLEHLRALRGHCMGHVWWQLNDCWPVISWSVIDSAGVRKPAWHAMRTANADRFLAVTGRRPRVVAVNETDEPWRDEVVVDVMDLDAGTVATRTLRLDAGPRSAVEVLHDAVSGDPAGVVVRARTADVVSTTWRSDSVHERLPRPEVAAEVVAAEAGHEVRVLATSLALDVCVFPDRLDAGARVDSGMVSLWPGERHTFHVRGVSAAQAHHLASRPALRALGDHV